MRIEDTIKNILAMGRREDITTNMDYFEHKKPEYRKRGYMDLLEPKEYSRVAVWYPDRWNALQGGYGWHVGNDNLQGYYLIVLDKGSRGVVMVHSARVNKISDEEYGDWKRRNTR